MNHVNTKEEVLEAFKVFDKDGQGYISVEDLRKVLTDLGDTMDANEINELLYEADPNNSGYVYYENFVSMLFLWD